MKQIIKLSTLLGNDIRSRINAKKIKEEIDSSDCKDIVIDFSGVIFISRSFSDELCSIIEQNASKCAVLRNMSEVVKTMIEVVKNGRKANRIRKKDNSEIKELNDTRSLSEFMLSL